MQLRNKIMLSLAHSKKAWFLNHVNDQYVKKAQSNNYRSRAAFKLLQIQERFKLIEKTQKILDLGAAPGSWSQAAKTLNPSIQIAAVDLLPMKQIEGVEFYQSDARSPQLHRLLKEKYGNFGAVISDMAPNFTGTLFETHEEMIELNKLSLQLSLCLGTSSCSLIMKTVQGEMEKTLVWLLQNYYREVVRFKPKASRSESVEHYLICRMMTKSEWREQDLVKLRRLQLMRIKTKKQLKQMLQE